MKVFAEVTGKRWGECIKPGENGVYFVIKQLKAILLLGGGK
jgi:hypothetical protein